jgi:hypothetical protein
MVVSSTTWRPDNPDRREAISKMLLTAGMLGMAMMPLARFLSCGEEDDDGVDQLMDAIELQRRTTWDFGAVDRGFASSGDWSTDCEGGDRWRAMLGSGQLAAQFAPPEGRLRPFYAPTLFQAPDDRAGRSLARHLFPIHNLEMDEAYARGRKLAEMFDAAGRPSDTAVVIDLPGPRAVALAAGLAELFSPVFTFDNWPHPQGVVPSHKTLEAALYYLPRFESAALHRPPSVAPAFVLDSNRLAPYRDAASEFDNRYVVSLPSFASMQELGILHIMYVTQTDPVRESDDLNADLVAFDGAGIAVRAVGLGDLQPDPDEAVGRVAVPDAGAPPSARHARTGSSTHVRFWRQYGWYDTRGGRGSAPLADAPSGASTYRPVGRSTLFGGRAFGASAIRPSGFGRITVHASSGGELSTGSGRGRSGSFGRGHSTFG